MTIFKRIRKWYYEKIAVGDYKQYALEYIRKSLIETEKALVEDNDPPYVRKLDVLSDYFYLYRKIQYIYGVQYSPGEFNELINKELKSSSLCVYEKVRVYFSKEQKIKCNKIDIFSEDDYIFNGRISSISIFLEDFIIPESKIVKHIDKNTVIRECDISIIDKDELTDGTKEFRINLLKEVALKEGITVRVKNGKIILICYSEENV